MKKFFTLIFLLSSQLFAENLNIVPGCNNEYCFAPCDGKANVAFNFYESMDKKSKITKKFPRGTKVKSISPFLEFVKPGKYIIIPSKVENYDKKIFKKGEIFTHRYHTGEGVWHFFKEGKSLLIEGIDLEADLKEVEPSVFINWYSLVIDGKQGYSDTDPFPDSAQEGCKK
jgi:hypothetical protein